GGPHRRGRQPTRRCRHRQLKQLAIAGRRQAGSFSEIGPVRIIVIGKEGQVARSLAERARTQGATAILLGRPKLDLADPSGIEDILIETGADLIVNAAAYTAVDQAESEPDLAEAINGTGAGVIAGVAAAMNVPVI